MKRLKALDPNRPIREADIDERELDVRFVPKADILRGGKERRYSITSSAREISAWGMVIPSVSAVLWLIINSTAVAC